jgi:hypothetical protein
MAEPSPEHIKQLSDLFCKTYNKLNGTEFVFDGIESEQNEADFYIRDKSNKISIQHSRIPSMENFFKSSAQTAIVNDKLLEMGDRLNLKCSVSMVFEHVPKTEEEINRFVRHILIFLSTHTKLEGSLLRFRKHDDLKLLSGIFDYLSEFKIISTGDNTFSIYIGNKDWSLERKIDDSVDYFLQEIMLKDQSYYPSNNLIILFEIDPLPIISITLEELRKKCSGIKFNCREIWQILLANDGFCDKIYPY